jgi:hypothetical protein
LSTRVESTRATGAVGAHSIVLLAILQCFAINNLDDTCSGEPDQAPLLKVGQRPAYGFRGDSQVVRDFVSGNGKGDAITSDLRQTVSHRDDERAHFLLDGNAANDQKLPL